MRRRFTLLALTLTLLVSLAAATTARAQGPVTFEVTADPTTVTVGDRIGVQLTLRLPVAYSASFTDLPQQFGDLDVLLIGLPEERPLGADQKEVRVRYEVAAFRVRDTSVPVLTITLTGPDGTAGTVASQPIPITVQSVLPPGVDPGTVRDLKEPIDLPYRTGGVSRSALLGLAALAVVAVAAVFVWRRLRRSSAPAAPLPQPLSSGDAAAQAARAELDRIGSLGLIERGDVREFHALLAACVRRYLSEHYQFPAVALTTGELRARMERHGVDRWQARLVAGLLSECDAVNYAGYTPAADRAQSNLTMAYEIVAVTAAQPEEPAAAAVGQ